MHHTGRVVSRTELVEHLYDQDFDRDSNTIEVFVGRIRKKLGVDDHPDGARSRLSAHAARCALIRWRSGCSCGPPAGPWSFSSSPASSLSSLYRHAVERVVRPPARRLSAHAGGRRRVAGSRRADRNSRNRSASRCSSCRCRAGIGRSRGSTAPSRTCIPRARCGTSNLPQLAGEGRRDRARRHLRAGYAQGPEEQRLRIIERNIDLGDDGRYLHRGRRQCLRRSTTRC